MRGFGPILMLSIRHPLKTVGKQVPGENTDNAPEKYRKLENSAFSSVLSEREWFDIMPKLCSATGDVDG